MKRRWSAAAAITVVTGTIAACSSATAVSAAAGDPNDANDAGAAQDASPAALYDGPCDPDKGFGTPVEGPFAKLNEDGIGAGAYLTADETGAFFATSHLTSMGSYGGIAFAAIESGVFAVQRGASIRGSDQIESGAVVSADGRTLWFRGESPAKPDRVMTSVRAEPAAAWQPPTPTSVIGADMLPQDVDDGHLWLLTREAGQVFRAPIADGGLGAPVHVDELGRGVLSVKVTDGGKRVYIGKEGTTWTATRSSAASAFGPLTVVPGFDGTPVLAMPTWVSKDNCRLVMTGAVAPITPMTRFKVLMATRPR